MEKRIIFLTQYDESGASSRIVIYQFLPFFREAGFEVAVRPLIKGDANRVLSDFAGAKNPFRLMRVLASIAWRYRRRFRDVIEAWSYDVAVVQKDVLPFGLRLLLKWKQKKIVYVFDDPIWVANPSSDDVKWLRHLVFFYRKRLLIRMLQCSKSVMVDSPYLRDFARTYVNDVVIVTAPVDTSKYRSSRPSDSVKPAFVWVGSPSTTYLLQKTLPLLEKLAKDADFCLYNIGSSPLTSPCFQIHNIEWSLENEQTYFSKSDIGLLPSDSRPFNLMRFSLKAVLYFCASLPTLAADLGLNRVMVQDGVTGLLYSSENPDDFVEKAGMLLRDKNLRIRMGRNARKVAETQYDINAQAPRYIDAVKRAMENAPSTTQGNLAKTFARSAPRKIAKLTALRDHMPALSKSDRCADIGTAHGGLTFHYARPGSWTFIDHDEKNLAVARTILNGDFLCDDVIPAMSRFSGLSLITAIDVLPYFDGHPVFLQLAHKALKRDGFLIVTGVEEPDGSHLVRLRKWLGLREAEGAIVRLERNTLRRQLSGAGFEVVAEEVFYGPLTLFLQTILDLLSRTDKPGDRLTQDLSQIHQNLRMKQFFCQLILPFSRTVIAGDRLFFKGKGHAFVMKARPRDPSPAAAGSG